MMRAPLQIDPWLKYETGYPDKHLVMNADDFQTMINFLDRTPVLTFDYETSGTRWFQQSESCGLGFAGWDPQVGELHNFYVPYRHHAPGVQQLSFDMVQPGFKYLLEKPNTMKVAHNLKFELHFAHKDGMNPVGPFYDTMIAAQLYDENRSTALKYRSETDLGRMDASHFEGKVVSEVERLAKSQNMGKKAYMKDHGYSQVNIPLVGTYGCFDVEFTTGLYALYEAGNGISKQYPRIWKTEMALVEAVVEMEETGMLVDVGYLEELKETLGQRKDVLIEQITAMIGRYVNPNSDDELRQMLYSWGCKLTKRTKTARKKNLWHPNAFAVDQKVLSSFKDRFPVLELIIEWRTADKLQGTYTDTILSRLDKQNRVHPDYQQVGTDTGRLSCQRPNFQNQPQDDSDRAEKYSGKKLKDGGIDPWSIRRAFIVGGPEIVRMFWDYSQIELRVIAFYSKDPIMVEAYVEGQDLHDRTAMEVFGTTDKEIRKYAKIINFGLSYGMTEWTFSELAKVEVDKAREYLGIFMDRYSGFAAFRVNFWNYVRSQKGNFQNLFGRPRRVPEICSMDLKLRGRGERMAISTLIQGTAAELTKESMVRIWLAIRARKMETKIVATVHDEIQFDVPFDELQEVSRIIKYEMENYQEFQPITIEVDAEWSVTSWADKKAA